MTACHSPALFSGEVFRATNSTASAWSVLRPWQQGLFIVLSVALLCSALAIVLVQHAHRQEMRQLHASMNERDQLNHAWSQLLVEQSAWAAMDHVEVAAREKLGMVIPDLTQVTYLTVDTPEPGRRIAQSDAEDLLAQKASALTFNVDASEPGALLARQKMTTPVIRPES